MAARSKAGEACRSRAPRARPTREPAVPGARGAAPAPKPAAMMWAALVCGRVVDGMLVGIAGVGRGVFNGPMLVGRQEVQPERLATVLELMATGYRVLLAATSPRRLAMQFCFQASIAVLILAILVPPFEGSDEFNHFERADQISAGRLVATRYGGPRTSGGLVDAGTNRIDAIIGIIRFHPEKKVTRPMMEAANAFRWGERVPTTFANTASYAPFLYVPAAIGVRLGRALRFSVAQTLIVSRALGGLVCVLVASAAVALAGEAALFLFAALSLPMAIFQCQAVSQDGLMISLAALAMAFVSRMPASRQTAQRVWLAGLTVCLALLSIGRPAYASFCVVPLLLPWLSWRSRACSAVCAAVPVAAWMLLTLRVTFFNAEDFRGVDAGRQLAGLLHHPGLLWTLAKSVVNGAQGMEGLSFFKEAVGVLGWLDVVLPGWFYTFAGGVLAAALTATLARERPILPAWSQGGLFLAATGAVILVFLLEYLSWTPVGFPIVQGVQGRYFLPVMMFLPGMLPAIRRAWFVAACGPARLALLVFPAISISVTISSVVRRYYL